MSRSQNRKGGKRGRAEQWYADSRDTTTLENAAFEAYYRGHVVPEAEWEAFMSSLREGLPMTARINPALPCAAAVDAHLSGVLGEVFATTRVPFVSDGRAIQCGVSRGDLKRNARLKDIKKMVAALNEGGFLTRQETVSMLPPVLLQVRPGDRVLDMCAAPGSKTSQILEVLVTGGRDTGVVVANDVNTTRLDILYHQTCRHAAAHEHIIVTNYDATRFPILASEHKFDRVLCDVMCSGDGTLRKSMDMWPRWNCLDGAHLHAEQCRVLLRGMANCRAGGVVVYSTCSMNPVEDEAVVSHCLRQHPGKFELIDPAELLPGLRSLPGMDAWTLTTRDLNAQLRSFADAQAYMASDAAKAGKNFQYRESMFADTPLLREQRIERCRRVLPHLQDTGGFFVAALRCVEELDTRPTEVAPSPLAPLPPDVVAAARQALSLPDDFPLETRCLARKGLSREAKLYYASEAVMQLFPLLGDRVSHAGVKIIEAFAKNSLTQLRFAADGAAALAELLQPPARFIVPVDPPLLRALAKETPMAFQEFFSRADGGRGVRDADYASHSLLLECTLPVVGAVYAPAERSAKFGKLVAKVPQWQLDLADILCPDPAKTEEAEEEATAGDEAVQTGEAGVASTS